MRFRLQKVKERRTPVWMSEKIFSLLPTKTSHELMVIERAAHGGMEAPEVVDYNGFVRQVCEFLLREANPPKL